ncbi:hypothetical protein VCV18_011866 [Metarhizium anisopliae]
MDAMFSSLRCYFLAPGPRCAAATPKTKDSLGVFAAAADGGEPQVDTWAKRHMVLDGYDGAVSLRRAGVSIEAAWRRLRPCPPPVPAPPPLRTRHDISHRYGHPSRRRGGLGAEESSNSPGRNECTEPMKREAGGRIVPFTHARQPD